MKFMASNKLMNAWNKWVKNWNSYKKEAHSTYVLVNLINMTIWYSLYGCIIDFAGIFTVF